MARQEGIVAFPGFRCSIASEVEGCKHENTDVLCSDLVDNDGNGFVDCEDFGCRFRPEVAVCGH